MPSIEYDPLHKHFISLLVIVHGGSDQPNPEQSHSFHSGFLMRLKDRYVWVTAGHCLRHIQEAIEIKGSSRLNFRWVDALHRGRFPESPFPVVALEERLECYLEHIVDGKKLGLDFGFVFLNELEIRAFLMNGVELCWFTVNWNSCRLA